jgi:hypothetical protein
MKALKGFANFVLILFILVFAQQVQAAWELPHSVHYEGSTNNLNMSGGTTITGHVDFAVYDTSIQTPSFPSAVPGAGRYIYAYQIFNEDPQNSIGNFAVFGLGKQSLDVDSDSITAEQDAPPVGAQPSNKSFTTSNIKAVWNFGTTLIAKGNHSWFLMFRSDKDWVAGTYEVKENADNSDFPVPSIPEPATIALLSFGSLMLVKRRRGK